MEFFPEWMKCCRQIPNNNENEKDVSLGTTGIKDNKSLDKSNIHIQINQENYEESKSSFTFHQNEDNKNSVTQKNEKLLNNPSRKGTITNHRLSKNSNYSTFSQVTFSNLKVKDFSQTASIVDTELVNKFELRLNGELFWNKELIVDCLGLQLGKRRKRDGITIFGTSNTEKRVGDYKNDFVSNINYGLDRLYLNGNITCDENILRKVISTTSNDINEMVTSLKPKTEQLNQMKEHHTELYHLLLTHKEKYNEI